MLDNKKLEESLGHFMFCRGLIESHLRAVKTREAAGLRNGL